MAIEIKELVIKVNVSGGEAAQKKEPASVSAINKQKDQAMSELIAEQVLDIIKRKEER